MSRADQQATTGVAAREPDRCACGCLEPFHGISETTKQRTGCSSSTCGCKRFEIAPDGDES